jgi:hypothetical protein
MTARRSHHLLPLVAFVLSFKASANDQTSVLRISKLPHPPHPFAAPAVHSFEFAATIWLYQRDDFLVPIAC